MGRNMSASNHNLSPFWTRGCVRLAENDVPREKSQPQHRRGADQYGPGSPDQATEFTRLDHEATDCQGDEDEFSDGKASQCPGQGIRELGTCHAITLTALLGALLTRRRIGELGLVWDQQNLHGNDLTLYHKHTLTRPSITAVFGGRGWELQNLGEMS